MKILHVMVRYWPECSCGWSPNYQTKDMYGNEISPLDTTTWICEDCGDEVGGTVPEPSECFQ